jgi:hypothetical protein
MRYLFALLVAVVGCATVYGDEPAKPADPVVCLKALLAKIEKEGTKPRVTDFTRPNEWYKARKVAVGIKYDVRRTDSLVSPFVATVTWYNLTYLTRAFPTREAARKAELPKAPLPGKGDQWWAKLAFQDGKWVVQDVGWDSEVMDFHRKHSTLDDERDPVNDWWWAFGGDVPANLEDLERRASERARRSQEEEAPEQEAERGTHIVKPREAEHREDAENKLREQRERQKAAEEAARWREWKRADGTNIGRARFMGMIAGKVKLKKEDETVIAVRLEDLGKDDRAWIQSRARPKKSSHS